MAGSLHSLIGTQQEAERLLQSALALDSKPENAAAASAANHLIYLAVAIARNGEYSRAIEILETQAHLISETSVPTFSARRDQLLARFRRRQAHRGAFTPISIGLNQPLRRARLAATDVDRLHLQVASAEQLLTLARFTLGSGQPEKARALTLEASVDFGEVRDERGIADCLSFLADIAETEGQWEKAYEFNRMASEVCARLEDTPREIASLAALAFTLHKLGDSSDAGQVAARCLVRAEGSQPSRPMLIACFVRAGSCAESGDLLGKVGAISTFVSIYPAVSGVDDLKPVRDRYSSLLTPPPVKN